MTSDLSLGPTDPQTHQLVQTQPWHSLPLLTYARSTGFSSISPSSHATCPLYSVSLRAPFSAGPCHLPYISKVPMCHELNALGFPRWKQLNLTFKVSVYRGVPEGLLGPCFPPAPLCLPATLRGADPSPFAPTWHSALVLS